MTVNSDVGYNGAKFISVFAKIPSLYKKLLSSMDKGFYNKCIIFGKYATSKSNVEPKLNFRLFQSQIRQSRT